MWTSLAMLAALTVTPAADETTLKVSAPRLCYGNHGPTRKTTDVLPGDSLDIAYRITGLSADNEGKVKFGTGLEIINKTTGKTIFKQDPQIQEALLVLGGNQWPGMTHVDIGLDSTPGDYKILIQVTDERTKQTGTVEQLVRVLPPAFGIVRLTTTSDITGRTPTAAPGTGETLWVNFAVIGFERTKDASKQPHLKVELKITDENGKATTLKPLEGVIKEGVPALDVMVPVQFQLPMNRAGKYQVQVKANCALSNQSSEISFPLYVAPRQQ